MSAFIPHQPLFSNHLSYLVRFLLYVPREAFLTIFVFFARLGCAVRVAAGLSAWALAWALCLSRRRGRCAPVPMTLSNLVLVFNSVLLYFMIVLLSILFSFVSSCGRSHVVSEAGAWSLARADPFLLFFLLCSLPICFFLVLTLTSGSIFHVAFPCGPPGLGGRGP